MEKRLEGRMRETEKLTKRKRESDTSLSLI